MSSWSNTRITELLKIQYPIFQGPMGRGGSTPLLVATVSNAGGLGSFGANDLPPEEITKTAAAIRQLTDKPFAMNLWVSTYDQGGDVLDEPTYDRVARLLEPFYKELNLLLPPFPEENQESPRNFNDQVAALLEAKPAVFSFIFGVPSEEILQECRKRGIITAGAATNVEEALALELAGVDMIVACGFEAGGHRPNFLKEAEDSLTGTFALVPRIVDKVKLPVVAAGGIADGRGIIAALVLGASAAQIGTSFLACDESGAHKLHKQLLFEEEAGHTTLSRAFTGRRARGLSNKFSQNMNAHESQFAKYPAHNWIVAPLRTAALAQGRTDLLNLWAGQAAPLVRHHKAAELFASLIRECDELLGALTDVETSV